LKLLVKLHLQENRIPSQLINTQAWYWIEVRDRNLPVSYANAFCNPVNPKTRDGLELESAKALKDECESLTKLYDLNANQRFLLTKNSGIEILDVKPSQNLKTILGKLEEVIKGGRNNTAS
jgi:hypothetical protein